MKKLSETLKELEIAFALPIEIKDPNGNTTYHEATNGFWYKYEYDANGNETYYETSYGFSCERKYDSNGNEIHFEDSRGYFENREYNSDDEVSYYEDSTGEKIGTPKSKTLYELSSAVACLLDEPSDITLDDLHKVQDLVTKLENSTEKDSI